MSDYVVQIEGLCKRFPGVQALNNASLRIKPGEVHGLVGENGAGKSTLIKILAGAQSSDAGSILIDGKPCEINSESEANALELHFIHQDAALVNRLSVAENLFLGKPLPKKRFGVSWETLITQSKEILAGFVDIDPMTPVSRLTVAERWMVAIARACAGSPRLVVMDEPTVALADSEVVKVFEAIAQLKKKGSAVLFVSHRLGEVLEIVDRVTVMKDSETVAELPRTGLTKDILIEAITGKSSEASTASSLPTLSQEQAVLEVENLSGGPLVNISFSLRPGEILGLGGLVGSGRTSLLLTLFGHHPPTSGQIKVKDKLATFHSPADGIRHGLALIPEDRRSTGIYPLRTIRENTVLAHLRQFRRSQKLPLPHLQSEIEATDSQIERLRIVTIGHTQRIGQLSGGNQQKVLLARWLVAKNTTVLLLDEPTKGVDVGARGEILRQIIQLAQTGVAVIIASSDLDEVAQIAHRVLVLREGRLVAEISHPITEAEILRHCYGHANESVA